MERETAQKGPRNDNEAASGCHKGRLTRNAIQNASPRLPPSASCVSQGSGYHTTCYALTLCCYALSSVVRGLCISVLSFAGVLREFPLVVLGVACRVVVLFWDCVVYFVLFLFFGVVLIF